MSCLQSRAARAHRLLAFASAVVLAALVAPTLVSLAMSMTAAGDDAPHYHVVFARGSGAGEVVLVFAPTLM